MKRITILSALALTFLLLTGVVPGAIAVALAKEPPIAAVAALDFSATTAAAMSICANFENRSVAEIPVLLPSPSPRTYIQCGACSDSPCRLTDIGHNCWKREGMQTYLGTCQEVVYPPYECTEDYLSRCTCMVGEVP